MREQLQAYIDDLQRKLRVAIEFRDSLPTHDDCRATTLLNAESSNKNTDCEPRVGQAIGEVPVSGSSKIDLVRRGIKPGTEFTVEEVEKWLIISGTTIDRLTLSQILSRMKKAGELEVVSQGSGRRPSIYKLK